MVLQHKRKSQEKIAIVSGNFLLSSTPKAANQKWEETAIEDLVSLLNNPKDSDICRLVTAKEIEDNGYKLQVSRYLKSDEESAIEDFLATRDTVNLGDIAEIKRPLTSFGKKSEKGVTLKEVTIGDINNSGLIGKGSKTIQIPETVMAKGRDQLLAEGDVLLSIKGSIGKAGVVGDLVDQTVPGQAFCVVKLRPNAPLNSKALVQYLRSEIGQCLFQKRSQGTGVAFIPMGDVKSILSLSQVKKN